MQQHFQCFGCGAQVRIGQPFCQNCGYQFTYSCPSCQASVDNRFAVCPNCGMPLGWPIEPHLFQQVNVPKSAQIPAEGKKRSVLPIVLIAIVCLLILSGGVIFAIDRFSQTNTTVSSIQTPDEEEPLATDNKSTDIIPPVISNVVTSFSVDTGALITWTTDEPAISQVEYGTTTAYGLIDTSEQSETTGHSVTLSNLDPDAIYHFRIKSKDASGNEKVDTDRTFTTSVADNTTAPVISTVNASDITASSANITWTTNEPATSQVTYGTSTAYGSVTELDANLVNSHSVTLSDLDPNTTYHYYVESEDDDENATVSDDYTFTTTENVTIVGGILDADTTWTQQNSPYEITDTIQVPVDVTLTIEPGVYIGMSGTETMFLVQGSIYAHGTVDDKIVFDAASNADVITASGESCTADLAYCIFRNGYLLWDGGGQFNLRNSEIDNLTTTSSDPFHKECIILESPVGDSYIERNKFINSGCIEAYQAAGRNNTIYITNNLFLNPLSPIQHAGGSPGSCEMLLKYNSFISVTGTMLSLEPIFTTTIMDATENYWGDNWGPVAISVIDSQIYDGNDDMTIQNVIQYQPILTEPHPNTPSL